MKSPATYSVRIYFLLSALLVLVAFAPTLRAAADDQKDSGAAAATKKSSPWTPEDIVYQEDAGQFEISPDGKSAVWVKSTADKDKDERVSNLFISNLSDGKQVQLTRGAYDVSQPRWSPSGETIAFLSSQPLPKPKPETAHMQLWLMNAAGGAPWSVTEFERDRKSVV